jgi:hypothetical protein
VAKKTKFIPKQKKPNQGITYGEPNPEGPPPKPKPAPEKTLSTEDIKSDKEP